MRVGPLLVGGAIGGIVWIVALRTSSHAAAAAVVPGPPPDPTPAPEPGQVRDAQGNIVGGADSGPITSPAAGTGDIAATAAAAVDTTVTTLQSDKHSVAVNGQDGAAQPMRVDGETRTVVPDLISPLGGMGVEQMGASVNRSEPAIPSATALPTRATSEAMYSAYLVAASGTTNGMTKPEIAALLSEGAEMGGLTA